MAEVYQRLGTGVATAAANLYSSSATASTYTVISTIVICNTSATAYTYNVSVSAVSATHGGYIANGASIAGNDTVALTLGICLDPTNRFLVAHASNAAVNISAFGVTGP